MKRLILGVFVLALGAVTACASELTVQQPIERSDKTVVHTPGHSRGSITVVLDNGEMIVGDLVRDTEGEIHLGSYYDDMEVLIQSLEKLSAYSADTIHLSHGATIDNAMLLQVIDGLKG